MSTKRDEIEKAIASLEAQRSLLGDSVVDPAIEAMREQLKKLNQQTPVEHQRKQVTILFMDIVNSTKLMSNLDPETVLNVMDNALQDLTEPVVSYGGRVTRYMGDGFLAIFGLPRSRENEPEMAIQAGLEMLKVSQSIAQRLETETGLSGFMIRIGINTGLVVSGGVTEAEDTLMGNAINLASRMESSAPANGILVSHYTYKHVRGVFEFKAGDKINVKGFSEPIRVYEVLGLKPSILRAIYRGIEGIEIPLIGRSDEIYHLKHTYEEIQNGLHYFAISGDTGIGKSRLIIEFEGAMFNHQSQPVFLRAKASMETQRFPYNLIRNFLNTQFSVFDNDLLDDVVLKYQQGLVPILTELESAKSIDMLLYSLGYKINIFSSYPDLENNSKIFVDHLTRILSRYISLITEEYPVIWFIEDFHWVDQSSFDLLEAMKSDWRSQQMLVVFLFRPKLVQDQSISLSTWFDTVINLGTLNQEESQEMVFQMLNQPDDIPGSFYNLISSTAGGNPYYIIELINMLREEEIIHQENGAWIIKHEELGSLDVPTTLVGVLQSRLDHLPMDERKTLQFAAIMGTRFWDDFIRYLASNSDFGSERTIDQLMASLSHRGLISEQSTSLFGDLQEYVFKNSILREVVYQSILLKPRLSYHKVTADWLLSNNLVNEDQLNGLTAYHLENAGEKELALEYYLRAATIAISKYALNEADLFYQKVHELTSNPVIRFDTLLGREFVMHQKGDRDQQRVILSLLMETADSLDDRSKKVEVLLREVTFLFWLGNFEAMLPHLDLIDDINNRIGNKSLQQKSAFWRSWSHLQLNRFGPAREHAELSLQLALELGDLENEASSHNALGMISLASRDYMSSLFHLSNFLSVSRKSNNLERELTALNNLGVAYTKIGHFEEAEKYYNEALSISELYEDMLNYSTSLVNLTWVLASQERWEEGLDIGLRALQLKNKIEHVEAVAEANMWMGHLHSGTNNYHQARNYYHQALIFRDQLQQEQLKQGAIAGLIRTEIELNRIDLAYEYALSIHDYLTSGGSLEATWEPFRIYYSTILGLKVGDDEKWKDLLKSAISLFNEYSSNITEPTLLEMFTTNIPWHKDLLQLGETFLS